MAKKTNRKPKQKSKQKSKKQLKALRELHNIVIQWTDEDFDKKGPFSEYCFAKRKKDKKMDKLLTDADIENLSIASLTNYLEDNSFQDENEVESDYDDSYPKKKRKAKKQKKSKVKKPLTAFNFFCKDRGKELRKKNPGLMDHDFWATLSAEWKILDDKKKKVYIKLSENDKKRYQKEKNKNGKFK